MAIAKAGESGQKDNLGDRCLWLIAISLLLSMSGCSESKLTQCEQIFKIAARVNDSISQVNYTNSEDSNQIKSWLEAAKTMNQAAYNIEALHINNGQLIGYQNQLATVYRIYSQATYNAVQARENKSLEALKLARLEAQKAGIMQQEAIENINAYCLNQ